MTFHIYQDNQGLWRWRLRAGDGHIIADSAGYSSKEACLEGVDFFKRSAGGAMVKEDGEGGGQ